MLKIFPEMVRYSSAYQINYKTFIFNAIFRIQLLSMNYWLIFYLLAEIFQDFQLTVITGIMEWKTTLYGWINLFPLDPQFISIFKKNYAQDWASNGMFYVYVLIIFRTPGLAEYVRKLQIIVTKFITMQCAYNIDWYAEKSIFKNF